MNNHHSTHRSSQHGSSAKRLILMMAARPLLLAAACGSSSSGPAGAAASNVVSTPNASTVATQALIEDVADAATNLNKALKDPDVASDAWRAMRWPRSLR